MSPSCSRASAIRCTLCRARLHARAICATVSGCCSTAARTRHRALVCPAGRASASPPAVSAPSRRKTCTTSLLSASPAGVRALTACCRFDRLPLTRVTAYCQMRGATDMDWKLELVTIPVSDVDRAKTFYVEQAGFVADHDHVVNDSLRFVQLTPPGSACSIAIGNGLTESAPGSAQMQLVVADVDAARDELISRGLDVGEVQRLDWGSFVFFADPDGNRWAVQQVPPRG